MLTLIHESSPKCITAGSPKICYRERERQREKSARGLCVCMKTVVGYFEFFAKKSATMLMIGAGIWVYK